MTDGHSPTVRRRRLGVELRRLREAAGKNIDEVAKHLECSPSKVSRIETGRVPVRARDVRDMLHLYEAPAEEHQALLNLARDSQQKGWWHQYGDVLRSQYTVYIGLEAEAASLWNYEAQFVHGLLQTEDYARAVFRTGQRPPEDVERKVAVRLARQSLLTRHSPLRLWSIMDEAVLHRQIGGRETMRAQLQRLAEALTLPNVTLQVLPFDAGAHAAMNGGFAILEFPNPADPKVVYLEQMTNDLYLEKSPEVDRYMQAFDSLRNIALSPEKSVAMIAAMATTP